MLGFFCAYLFVLPTALLVTNAPYFTPILILPLQPS